MKIIKYAISIILTIYGLMTSTLATAQEIDKSDRLYAYVPKYFVIQEAIEVGDLNKDGLKDKVLIIKNTLPSEITTDEETGEKHNLYHRGMVVLFSTKSNGYVKAAENLDCFESEDGYGGVYCNLDLMVHEWSPTNLVFGFSNGRYGNNKFTFRYQQGGFKLIGYDQNDCNGPFTLKSISINFLSGKKQTMTNIRQIDEINRLSDADPDYKDQFTERWTTIKRMPLLDFTEIKSFEYLSFE